MLEEWERDTLSNNAFSREVHGFWANKHVWHVECRNFPLDGQNNGNGYFKFWKKRGHFKKVLSRFFFLTFLYMAATYEVTLKNYHMIIRMAYFYILIEHKFQSSTKHAKGINRHLTKVAKLKSFLCLIYFHCFLE